MCNEFLYLISIVLKWVNFNFTPSIMLPGSWACSVYWTWPTTVDDPAMRSCQSSGRTGAAGFATRHTHTLPKWVWIVGSKRVWFGIHQWQWHRIGSVCSRENDFRFSFRLGFCVCVCRKLCALPKEYRPNHANLYTLRKWNEKKN